ncbi:MAG TPA: insulinase family protein [Vicinamibacteria bacterium]|nr:insulinase family protein [Vicinamibacteria bacterium]
MTPRATPASPPAGRAGRILPFEAVERTLPNGLKVIVVPTSFPNIVSLQIPVQTGSRNEVEPGKSGFAHFFEHMMFRGTKAFPPEAYQAVLTRAGARQNAYTTDDYTNYHTTFAKEDLETILEVEADRFQNLEYPVEAFKTESRAVLGEYNKNSANPIQKLFEVQRESAFKVHTYRHTTMGFLKDIEDMPNQFEYSRTFFDRWYRPEHTTLIVAGDVSAAIVLPLVEKYWGGWKPGSYKVEVPAEPAPTAPVKAHVAWPSPTLPWVSVAFHAPAFSETSREWAALDILSDLSFGPTSLLYKKLVEQEQKVDRLRGGTSDNVDPELFTVFARVKKAEDVPYVRDEILKAFAAAAAAPPPATRVADAKSANRYGFLRGLDNTEAIAGMLARFVRYRRSYDTVENLYRTYEQVTPADIQAAAKKYVVDVGLVQTTLSHDPLPPATDTIPRLASLDGSAYAAAEAAGTAPATPPPVAAGAGLPLKPLVVASKLPQLDVKLLFAVGSVQDPKGKEGLAALSAAMMAEAGSKAMTIDAIRKALFPMAASFDAQVDKEMTTFTARVHRDNWPRFAAIALPQLCEPGFREEDFRRLKDQQRNALVQDLRTNNEEELGKERLQGLLFAGTPYAHPVLGTVAGIDAITLDDVKQFVAKAYTRAALRVGLSGDLAPGLEPRLGAELAKLPAGAALPPAAAVSGHAPKGLAVDIVEKDTRATAISFGHPIAVTRSHPDYPALYLARTWLGEHRSSTSHLYQRIREVRGMNYGDYAYIEAFPAGMYRSFPPANVARRAQIFEVWIRPVVPENGPMALRIALHEVRALVEHGLTQQQFEATRDYLMKNVFLLTSTQDLQLGYALDSQWYGIPEYTGYMRDRLSKLTLEEVNAAVRRHLSGRDLQIVVITKDAEGLAGKLTTEGVWPIHYDAPKPKELLDEDQAIAAETLGITRATVRITPVDEVFAR